MGAIFKAQHSPHKLSYQEVCLQPEEVLSDPETLRPTTHTRTGLLVCTLHNSTLWDWLAAWLIHQRAGAAPGDRILRKELKNAKPAGF